MGERRKSSLLYAVTWLFFASFGGCSEQILVDDLGEFTTQSTDAASTSDPQTDTETQGSTDSDSDTLVPGVCGDDPESPIVPRPADVIVVVDNSAKMEAEVAMTQEGIVEFYSALAAAQTRPQVTLISARHPPNDPKEKNGICVPEPLGSGSCPDDSRPPVFEHLPLSVGSKDALSVLHAAYADWKERLRVGADLHLLVISDDDSDMTSEQFSAAMSSLSPPVDFFFHAIAPATDREADCALDPPGPCCEDSANIGAVYKELVEATDGIFGDLCRQDFASDFSSIADKIVQVSCRSSAR